MELNYNLHDSKFTQAMQLADKLLEMIKGQIIIGKICAAFGLLAFIGFLSGASHQLAIAFILLVVALVLFSGEETNSKKQTR